MKASKITLQILYRQGVQDSKSLARLSGVSLSTAKRDLKKTKAGLLLERKPGSGRPQKFTAQDKRRLVQLARQSSTKSSRELQIDMVEKESPEVSPSTIRRYLNRSGYYCKSPMF